MTHFSEEQIYRSDNLLGKVCFFLSGAKSKDVTRGLPQIIKPTDYYAFLFSHVGTNDTTKGAQKTYQVTIKS